ncbi:PepSY domain-containing protein [Methylosinus sp. Sm6]|uniref:PepSY-associated TM helix domain-containing protein n=1 Tax=Methylosinus sp. Sm6 TaxID=2866948 RepID=UPI001C98F8B5|nr:PepSY domain-containing protein [Methylosinus sp. Sm6]MBY6239874.1 PepSY domain-containing protein [Methylosinus sp. Sm6]
MNIVIRSEGADRATYRSAAYRVIWRWHFYAGLFCLPFVFVLTITGAIYLFKPQIDAFLDRPYDQLTLSGAPRSLDEQVAAAQAAMPDARLTGIELRADPRDAARVLFSKNVAAAPAEEFVNFRVLVRPDTLEILTIEDERFRPSRLAGDIHGDMLLGGPGHIALELAGAWAIVMIVTGLYLWWPRDSQSLAGILYPRLSSGRRLFWRDLHAVTGFWISFFALFLLLTALPWTTVWGKSFRYLRSLGEQAMVKQDWTTGPDEKQAQRKEGFQQAAPAPSADPHAGHHGHHGGAMPVGRPPLGFDKAAATAAGLGLADPVTIAPPAAGKPNWVVKSTTQNRPLRRTVELDPTSFETLRESGFFSAPLIDRLFGIGIAAHEGQLFGWLNQLLGLLTAIGYLLLVVSSAVMWWRRRPRGALGAPPALSPEPRLAPLVLGLVVALAVFLPTLGLSLLFVLAIEQIIRRFLPGARGWLGLRPI